MMLPLPGTVHGDSDRDTAVDGTDVDQPQNHTVVDASLKSPDCAEPVISSRYASVFVHKGIVQHVAFHVGVFTALSVHFCCCQNIVR